MSDLEKVMKRLGFADNLPWEVQPSLFPPLFSLPLSLSPFLPPFSPLGLTRAAAARDV